MMAGLAAVSSIAACGGGQKGAVTAAETHGLDDAAIDEDPIRLLPGSTVWASTIDMKAFAKSEAFHASVARLESSPQPIVQKLGIVPSRDVDRVTVGGYSTQGVDAVAVVTGRFDRQRIKQAAADPNADPSVGPITSSTYGGRPVYIAEDVHVCVLTDHTALVGSQAAVRRVIDRVTGGRRGRAVVGWVTETLETKGADFAVAVDLTNPPAVPDAVGKIPLGWVRTLKAARIIGHFQSPGLQAASTLTYATEGDATAAQNELQTAVQVASLVALTGIIPKFSATDIQVDGKDVKGSVQANAQDLQLFTDRVLVALAPTAAQGG